MNTNIEIGIWIGNAVFSLTKKHFKLIYKSNFNLLMNKTNLITNVQYSFLKNL